MKIALYLFVTSSQKSRLFAPDGLLAELTNILFTQVFSQIDLTRKAAILQAREFAMLFYKPAGPPLSLLHPDGSHTAVNND